MRTTLTLDNDVAEMARRLAAATGRPFKSVVNQALRSGLQALQGKGALPPYRTRARRMGLQPGVSLDNVQELLSRLEGEDAR